MIYRTFTNRILNLSNLKVDDIDIKDIAWSLSHQVRFGGHLIDNYTVADHSIYMAKKFIEQKDYHNALHALLHDSTEAYITDIPSPVKELIPQIRLFEAKIYEVIAKKFNLDAELPHKVEVLDKSMIKIEIEQFFEGIDHDIKMYKEEGYQVFLDLFHEIQQELSNDV